MIFQSVNGAAAFGPDGTRQTQRFVYRFVL
jgi:hypothetical protein